MHVILLLQTQDFIKGAGSLSGWSSDSHKRGMDSLRAYTSSGGCRCGTAATAATARKLQLLHAWLADAAI
jgi:hypothetical protein